MVFGEIRINGFRILRVCWMSIKSGGRESMTRRMNPSGLRIELWQLLARSDIKLLPTAFFEIEFSNWNEHGYKRVLISIGHPFTQTLLRHFAEAKQKTESEALNKTMNSF